MIRPSRLWFWLVTPSAWLSLLPLTPAEQLLEGFSEPLRRTWSHSTTPAPRLWIRLLVPLGHPLLAPASWVKPRSPYRRPPCSSSARVDRNPFPACLPHGTPHYQGRVTRTPRPPALRLPAPGLDAELRPGDRPRRSDRDTRHPPGILERAEQPSAKHVWATDYSSATWSASAWRPSHERWTSMCLLLAAPRAWEPLAVPARARLFSSPTAPRPWGPHTVADPTQTT